MMFAEKRARKRIDVFMNRFGDLLVQFEKPARYTIKPCRGTVYG
jgi:hypothetical protein